MKKIKYPDYANSTVSLANSILKYFGRRCIMRRWGFWTGNLRSGSMKMWW